MQPMTSGRLESINVSRGGVPKTSVLDALIKYARAVGMLPEEEKL